jgi:polar amino acid transport system substrate-binding protein
MKKKFISILTVSVLAVTMLAGCKKESDTLIVGTEAGFAPYEYMEGDKVVGVDMDIAQAIADAMGKKLVIENMDFDGALMAVQNGKVDFVAAGVSVDEERQKVMDFSEDYVDSTEVVVVNKATPAVSAVSNDDLADKVLVFSRVTLLTFMLKRTLKQRK